MGDGYAKENGVKVGDTLTVDFAHGRRPAKLKVAAVTNDDTAVDSGAMYTQHRHRSSGMCRPTRCRSTGSCSARRRTARRSAAYAALKKTLKPYPQFRVRDQADHKEALEDQVGQLLYMIYGLLGAGDHRRRPRRGEHPGPVGGRAHPGDRAHAGHRPLPAPDAPDDPAGVGGHRRSSARCSASASAWAGAPRRRRLLALEGLKILQIPWPTILAVFVGSAVVGLIAALVPAFRAGRMNVLNAIATD